ncbi:MBL fold metallo-hydrolase [Candidatus Peregrinibacteria bacterium]|nr:MBL fold metallo-hydrolase [Candidatus Peregrinibacteria bacterium]
MIEQIAIGGYDNNFSYFIGDNARNVAVVDPSNVSFLIELLEQEGLTPKMVLVTHSHFDHTDGVKELCSHYGIPVYAHKNARERLEITDSMIVPIEDNEELRIGDLRVKVMHTPGHIDDAVCYYVSKEHSWDDTPRLITGDTLFVGRCGRADFDESDIKDFYKSLQRIKKLPDNTEIYPGRDYGQDPVSTIKHEKKHNKHLKCESFKEFEKKMI